MQNRTNKTAGHVALALLAAIIVVLQLFGSMIHIGPVSFTFVLVPIVIGGVLYGPGAGAFLGAVFGGVTIAGCMSGADPGGFILWAANPWLTALLCFAKATLAGLCSALVYRATSKRGVYLGVLLAALTAPIVNTGIFCTFMLLPYREILREWAAGTDVIRYLLISIVGVNFLVELGLNAVLCPGICRVVNARRKK